MEAGHAPVCLGRGRQNANASDRTYQASLPYMKLCATQPRHEESGNRKCNWDLIIGDPWPWGVVTLPCWALDPLSEVMGRVGGEIPVYLTYLLYLRNTTSLPTYNLKYFHSWHWPVKSSIHPRPDYPVAATAGSERKTWERSLGGLAREMRSSRARAPRARIICMYGLG